MLTDLPNLLTLARIAAIPGLIALMAQPSGAAALAACAVFAGAGLTDYLDGAIARSRGQTSPLGRLLDPIADKLLVGAALIMLLGTGRLGAAGLYPALAILLRELLVSGLREYLAGTSAILPVTPLAKWKTAAQMGALGLLLAGDSGAASLGLPWLKLDRAGIALLWIAAALTLVTGWDYLRATLRLVVPAAADRR